MSQKNNGLEVCFVLAMMIAAIAFFFGITNYKLHKLGEAEDLKDWTNVDINEGR